jgi:hypothetical protein
VVRNYHQEISYPCAVVTNVIASSTIIYNCNDEMSGSIIEMVANDVSIVDLSVDLYVLRST